MFRLSLHRALPFLVTAALIFAVLAGGCLEFDRHDHTGADCPACLLLDTVKNIIKALGMVSLSVLFAAPPPPAGTGFPVRAAGTFPLPPSLLRLKVKSNS
jgi:hypothetical protein